MLIPWQSLWNGLYTGSMHPLSHFMWSLMNLNAILYLNFLSSYFCKLKLIEIRSKKDKNLMNWKQDPCLISFHQEIAYLITCYQSFEDVMFLTNGSRSQLLMKLTFLAIHKTVHRCTGLHVRTYIIHLNKTYIRRAIEFGLCVSLAIKAGKMFSYIA